MIFPTVLNTLHGTAHTLYRVVHICKMYYLNPATYYTHQLKGNLKYPIYQSGRGLGSRLFDIVKSVGAPLLKEIILPTVKAEAGQVIKDITSGVGVKMHSSVVPNVLENQS